MTANSRFLLVVGGARSGKSDFAVEAGRRWGGPVTFVATAVAGDAEMARRIEHHRQDRPSDWTVVEETLSVASAVSGIEAEAMVIIDCLTMWVANAIFADRTDEQIWQEARLLGAALVRRPGRSVVVSNEVGLGIHPDNELGRRYQDLLGRVNRALADQASATLFFVAGRAMALNDPWAVVGDW